MRANTPALVRCCNAVVQRRQGVWQNCIQIGDDTALGEMQVVPCNSNKIGNTDDANTLSPTLSRLDRQDKKVIDTDLVKVHAYVLVRMVLQVAHGWAVSDHARSVAIAHLRAHSTPA